MLLSLLAGASFGSFEAENSEISNQTVGEVSNLVKLLMGENSICWLPNTENQFRNELSNSYPDLSDPVMPPH